MATLPYTNGDDKIYGTTANDTLKGGRGDDQLYGGGGADTYVYSRGDGHDEIFNSTSSYTDTAGSVDVLTFQDIKSTEVSFSKNYNHLVITLLDGTGSLTIDDYFATDGKATGSTMHALEKIRFSDGVAYNVAQAIANTSTDDSVYGSTGNDSIVGGLGNDDLYGGGGSDAYIYSRGEGNDEIINSSYSYTDSPGSVDVLEFNGIKSTQVSLTRDYNDLVISLLDGTGSVTINDYFAADGKATGSTVHALEKIKFSDGVEYNIAQAIANTSTNDSVYGSTGNDSIVGGLGNDDLYGGGGSDTYIYSRGEGHDEIINSSYSYTDSPGSVDVLEFKGIKSTQVELSRDYNDLVISLLDGSGSVTISDYFAADGKATGSTIYAVEKIKFSDGVEYNIAQTIANTISNDTVYGSVANDIIATGIGNDTLYGGGGADTYIYSRGNGQDKIINSSYSYTDTLNSTDVLEFKGINSNQLSFTRDYNDLIVSLLDGSGSVTISDYYASNTLYKVEKVKFADGVSYDNVLGSTSTMTGTAGNDLYIKNANSGSIVEQANAGIDTVQASINYTLENANLENLLLIGDATSGSGNSRNNVITGNALNNTLNGKAGADTLIGGLGNDTFYVDNAGDKVVELAGQGTDLVYSSVSFALGAQHIEKLTLTGTASIDAKGNSLNNSIVGNNGNNVLDGGKGADALAGGLGNDTYYIDNAGDKVVELENQGTDKIFSSVSYKLVGIHVETLELIGSANLNATGNFLSNTLKGNSGDNVLNGNKGVDTLIGGLGNDTYYVDNLGDRVVEKDKGGTDKVFSSVSFNLSGQFLESLELTGSTGINAVGNTLKNTLTGNLGNNVLDGGKDADTLIGSLGNDTYYVDDSGDKVVELDKQGVDKVVSSVSFNLSGQFLENLDLSGGDNVNATGNKLQNRLTGNNGNNILDGGKDADTLIGGLGNDTYYVDNVADRIIEAENQGADKVLSNVSFSLSGQFIESLELTGSTSVNATGNSLNNSLIGNSANNILNGAQGNDNLKGGSGQDTAVYKLIKASDNTGGNGTDIWSDFTVGKTASNANADKIDVSDLLIGYEGNGSLSSLSSYLSLSTSNGNTTLSIDRDGAGSAFSSTALLTLSNVQVDLATLLNNQQIVV